MWNEVKGEVRKRLYPFNDAALRGYREAKVNDAVKYLDMVFREAMKLFKGEIQYLGYQLLSPEQRIAHMLASKYSRGFNVQRTELSLVRFDFEFAREIFSTTLYVPYMVDGAIVVDDIVSYIQVAEIERVFSRIRDGLIAKVLRSPLFFKRTEQLAFASTKGINFCDAVITTKIHYKKMSEKRKFKTALLLYFLSSFGLTRTLTMFEIDHSEVVFVNQEDPCLSAEWHEFKIKPDLYLQVKTNVMEDATKRKVITSLIYCLATKYAETQLDRITDPNGSIWKILLGKSIFGVKTNDISAHQYAEAHLESLATYLDPFTQKDLAVIGIFAEDIYDLLLLAFKNLHTWLAEHRPNDLYEKKVGVLELIMADMVKDIFHRAYNTHQANPTLKKESVRHLLRFSSRKISSISRCGATISAQIYHDNPLFYAYTRRSRQPISMSSPGRRQASRKKSGSLIHSPEYRFDPSFMVVESILDMSSASPGDSGAISPYCPIDANGGFFKPDYASVLDPLIKFLPRR